MTNGRGESFVVDSKRGQLMMRVEEKARRCGAGLRRNMGIALPGYPWVIPVSSRVPAYVIPTGNTTG